MRRLRLDADGANIIPRDEDPGVCYIPTKDFLFISTCRALNMTFFLGNDILPVPFVVAARQESHAYQLITHTHKHPRHDASHTPRHDFDLPVPVLCELSVIFYLLVSLMLYVAKELYPS